MPKMLLIAVGPTTRVSKHVDYFLTRNEFDQHIPMKLPSLRVQNRHFDSGVLASTPESRM